MLVATCVDPIAACCTLHNLRIDMGDVMERAYTEPALIEEGEVLGNVVMGATGDSNPTIRQKCT